MLIFKLLLPLLAQVDPVQEIQDTADLEDQIVVLEDPSEIYEIEFDADEELEGFSLEDYEFPPCPN